MGLKINNSNISQLKINGTNIEMAKFNGSIIFDGGDLTITVTFSEKDIAFLSNKTGIYDFYYADDNGIISDYEKIVTLSLKKNIERVYSYFNELNIAPYQATKIVVCEKNKTNILASYNLPSQFIFDSSIYGNKLYSVGVFSDIHIDGDGTNDFYSIDDFSRAMQYCNDNNITYVAVAGDIGCNFFFFFNVEKYNELLDNYPNIDVKVCVGNHDINVDYENMLGIQQNYVYEYNNDVYLFVSLNAVDRTNPLSSEQITWLSNKFQQYSSRRIFLFFHFYIDPVGNVDFIHSDTTYLSETEGTSLELRNLLAQYNNVIMFSGHSHLEYRLQALGEYANIKAKTDTMCNLVHISSLAAPRNRLKQYVSEASEGYIMDVYKNCIVLRGRDFIKEKFLPIANYLLSTVENNGGAEPTEPTQEELFNMFFRSFTTTTHTITANYNTIILTGKKRYAGFNLSEGVDNSIYTSGITYDVMTLKSGETLSINFDFTTTTLSDVATWLYLNGETTENSKLTGLKSGSNYTLTYTNNTGNDVVINGIGYYYDYKQTVTTTFTINSISIS